MYKCLNCGMIFEHPIIHQLYVPAGFIKTEKICPECRIDDLERLKLCRCGRKYITELQDRCDLCEEEIRQAMSEARERIMNGCNVDFHTATDDIVYWIEREA